MYRHGTRDVNSFLASPEVLVSFNFKKQVYYIIIVHVYIVFFFFLDK